MYIIHISAVKGAGKTEKQASVEKEEEEAAPASKEDTPEADEGKLIFFGGGVSFSCRYLSAI